MCGTTESSHSGTKYEPYEVHTEKKKIKEYIGNTKVNENRALILLTQNGMLVDF